MNDGDDDRTEEQYERKLSLLQTAFPGLDAELLGLVLASNLSSVEESIKFLTTPEQRVTPMPTLESSMISDGHQQRQSAAMVVQTAEAGGADEMAHGEEVQGNGITDSQRAEWKAQLYASWREELGKMPKARRQQFIAKMPELDVNQGNEGESNDDTSPAEGRKSSLRSKFSSAISNLRRSRDGSQETLEMFTLEEDELHPPANGQVAPREKSGILQYERHNNPLVVALREKAELRDLVQFAEDIKVISSCDLTTPSSTPTDGCCSYLWKGHTRCAHQHKGS